jgi:hypothetical protein
VSIALDYETRIDPAALRAAGVTDVCRYLSWPNWWGGMNHSTMNPKIIQAPEYRELRAAGIGVTLNWEYDQHDWLTGAAGGKAHGDQAVKMARQLGYPAGRVIIGSADFDMTLEQWTSAGMAYGVTFAASLRAGGYEMGVYGPWDVLGWCASTPGIRPRAYWQCMSTSFSGRRNARPHPAAQLWQRRTVRVGGIQADQSDIIRPDWGQDRRDDMDQSEQVQGAYARQGQRVGDVFADLANFRDWLYDHPDQDGNNPPPAGSRADTIYQAATRATEPLDYDRLAAALLRQLAAAQAPVKPAG